MNRIKEALTRKIGPLPAWAWLSILAGVLLYMRNRTASSTTANTASTDQVAQDQAGQSAIQEYLQGEAAGEQAAGQGGGYNTGDATGSGTSGDQAQAIEDLAQAVSSAITAAQNPTAPPPTTPAGPPSKPSGKGKGHGHGRGGKGRGGKGGRARSDARQVHSAGLLGKARAYGRGRAQGRPRGGIVTVNGRPASAKTAAELGGLERQAHRSSSRHVRQDRPPVRTRTSAAAVARHTTVHHAPARKPAAGRVRAATHAAPKGRKR